jgi:hypothetical protein
MTTLDELDRAIEDLFAPIIELIPELTDKEAQWLLEHFFGSSGIAIALLFEKLMSEDHDLQEWAARAELAARNAVVSMVFKRSGLHSYYSYTQT